MTDLRPAPISSDSTPVPPPNAELECADVGSHLRTEPAAAEPVAVEPVAVEPVAVEPVGDPAAGAAVKRRAPWLARARRLLPQRPWARSLLLAAAIYVVVVGVYFAVAPKALILDHTPFNHFAHLARAWLDGHLDLKNGPPAYAQNNDFANFDKKWFVAFPPFPAVILLPFVAYAREPELVRDGQVFLWLAGLGPALLFLGLERLRRNGLSQRSVWENLTLALVFAFGTVFFFTAEQGTVWFAAHVVGVSLAAGILFFSINASFPLAAGICVGLASLTRPPLLFAVPLFVLEAWRVSQLAPTVAPPGTAWWRRMAGALWTRCDYRKLLRLLLLFGLPIACAVAISAVHNYLRFGNPFDTGYQYLTVAWQARMKKWGLFHFHYLPRNLGVLLTQLPWPEPGKWSFKINVHGLALWFTSPFYIWLLWPKHKPAPHVALWLAVAAVAVPTLFYQNTGWSQFGYRFSNDYAVFLFALLALGGRRLYPWMLPAFVFAIVVNTFGALTFGRSEMGRYYYSDPSQQKYYQPD